MNSEIKIITYTIYLNNYLSKLHDTVGVCIEVSHSLLDNYSFIIRFYDFYNFNRIRNS